MSYAKLNLQNGTKLTAEHLAHVETGITNIDNQLEKKPGEIVANKQYSINGNIVTAQANAEVYNTDLNAAVGVSSHAEGNQTFAIGNYSHTEGNKTISHGNSSHAEGMQSIASGNNSHAEGAKTYAYGDNSHVEGYRTIATDAHAHAEGYLAKYLLKLTSSSPQGASWRYGIVDLGPDDDKITPQAGDFVWGPVNDDTGVIDFNTTVLAVDRQTSTIQFNSPIKTSGGDIYIYGTPYGARANSSHTEGISTTALGKGSHAEGLETKASGDNSHAEGFLTNSYKDNSHAEGRNTVAHGANSHAEGIGFSIGWTLINNGSNTWTYSKLPVLENGNEAILQIGDIVTFQGQLLKIEEINTSAKSVVFAPAVNTSMSQITVIYYGKQGAYGSNSHAEGSYTCAEGNSSHAEGYRTVAHNNYSHAEGYYSKANGAYSHVEGYYSEANGSYSHAEGSKTVAQANYSHAEGCGTVANSSAAHVEGRYNIIDTNDQYAHILGGGTAANDRRNLYTVDWLGNASYQGSIFANGGLILSNESGYGSNIPSDADEGRVFFMPDNTSDSIVKSDIVTLEGGNKPSWYYECYESGIVKMWGQVSATLTENQWLTEAGGISQLSFNLQSQLPVNLQTKHIEKADAYTNNFNLVSLVDSKKSNSLQHTKQYMVGLHGAPQTVTVTVHYFIVGKLA